jgi:hypothetical protein
MSEYSQLKEYCKTIKIKVEEVPTSRLKDYAAMNPNAARKIGYPKMKKNTIFIDRNLSSRTKYRTLHHEMIEMNLMEKKHYLYWKAHKIALRLEGTKWKPTR